MTCATLSGRCSDVYPSCQRCGPLTHELPSELLFSREVQRPLEYLSRYVACPIPKDFMRIICMAQSKLTQACSAAGVDTQAEGEASADAAAEHAAQPGEGGAGKVTIPATSI